MTPTPETDRVIPELVAEVYATALPSDQGHMLEQLLRPRLPARTRRHWNLDGGASRRPLSGGFGVS